MSVSHRTVFFFLDPLPTLRIEDAQCLGINFIVVWCQLGVLLPLTNILVYTLLPQVPSTESCNAFFYTVNVVVHLYYHLATKT